MKFHFLLFPLALALHPVKDFRVKDLGTIINHNNHKENVIDSLPTQTKTVSTTSSLSSSAPTIELDNDVQMVFTDNTKSIYYLTSKIWDEHTNYNETFRLLLDTGSSISWVYNQSCESDACKQTTISKFNDFSRPLVIESNFGLSYSGQNVEGDLINGLSNDIIMEFDNFRISNFSFGLASTVPDLFNGFNVSGILGIPSSSDNINRNLIHQLNEKGDIDGQIFGLSLLSTNQIIKYIDSSSDMIDLPSNYGGLMIFGSKATNDLYKFTDNIYYTPLLENDDDYWLINLTNIETSNDTVTLKFNESDSRKTIIDTGTTGFVLPLYDADNLHTKLFGDDLITDNKGNYAFPCDCQNQNITFTINDHDFEVNVNDFKGKEYTTTGLEGKCASMIQGLDSQYWVFGAAFLSKYYTVFDLEKSQIGFGDTRITSYVLKEPSNVSFYSSYSNTTTTSISSVSSMSTTSSSSSLATSSTSNTEDNSATVNNVSGLSLIIYLLLCIIIS